MAAPSAGSLHRKEGQPQGEGRLSPLPPMALAEAPRSVRVPCLGVMGKSALPLPRGPRVPCGAPYVQGLARSLPSVPIWPPLERLVPPPEWLQGVGEMHMP